MDYSKIIGEDWLKFLPKAPELLDPIRKRLAEERDLNIVILPEREKIFRVFKETRPQDIKILLLGQDPYHNPVGQATGRAFECGVSISPSWRKIAEAYRREVDKFNPQISSGNLSSWADQGMFLLNTALTVRNRMPGSHIKLWEPFTKYVIGSILNDIDNPKAVILLGNEAKKVIPNAPAPHQVFRYEHPAAATYTGRPWLGGPMFSEVEKFLKFNDKKFNW